MKLNYFCTHSVAPMTSTITTPGNSDLLGILGIFVRESWENSPEIARNSAADGTFLTEIPVFIG